MVSIPNQRTIIRSIFRTAIRYRGERVACPNQDRATYRLGSDGQQPFTTQLFGSRELTLAMAIMDTSPELRTRALQLGLLVDSLDVLAAVGGVSAVAHCQRPVDEFSPAVGRHCSLVWAWRRWQARTRSGFGT